MQHANNVSDQAAPAFGQVPNFACSEWVKGYPGRTCLCVFIGYLGLMSGRQPDANTKCAHLAYGCQAISTWSARDKPAGSMQHAISFQIKLHTHCGHADCA